MSYYFKEDLNSLDDVIPIGIHNIEMLYNANIGQDKLFVGTCGRIAKSDASIEDITKTYGFIASKIRARENKNRPNVVVDEEKAYIRNSRGFERVRTSDFLCTGLRI